MKHSQRFDHGRLAEALQETGFVEAEVLREVLHQSQSGGAPFTEALVASGLVADWDLSRVVCETFNLPFLPVDMIEPDPQALDGLDKDFLRQHALVPLARFGKVLTVSMPGLVTADVLGVLAAQTDLKVLPVVGTVHSNRRWVEERFGGAPASAPGVQAPAKGRPVPRAAAELNWSTLFDDADKGILQELERGGLELEFQQREEEPPAPGLENVPGVVSDSSLLDPDEGELALELEEGAILPPPDEDELGQPGSLLPPAPRFEGESSERRPR